MVISTSSTVIGHMYYFEGTNVKRSLTVKTGNLWSDITDHLSSYLIINSSKHTKTIYEERPCVRIYSDNNIHNFDSLIQHVD